MRRSDQRKREHATFAGHQHPPLSRFGNSRNTERAHSRRKSYSYLSRRFTPIISDYCLAILGYAKRAKGRAQKWQELCSDQIVIIVKFELRGDFGVDRTPVID